VAGLADQMDRSMIESVAAVDRDDPARILPVALPREFARYETPVPLLGAGRPGKLGLMELRFARRGDRTRMVHHYYRSPLQMFQPMYYDPMRPDMPIVVLLQNGGGMLQGDRYRIDIDCGVDAAAHITTQSAGKLYKCEENYITQVIDIVAHAGSLVEFLPDMTIPFRGSRYFQHIELCVDPTATVFLGDVLAPGRTAYGEHHAYSLLHTQLEASDPDGKLLVADRISLEPERFPLQSPALFGDFDALGVLYVFSRLRPAAELAIVVRTALEGDAHTMSGVSELPNDCGISVRILGTSAGQVDRMRTVAWNAARIALIGVPAPNMRKA
jgi:urease accessory protein